MRGKSCLRSFEGEKKIRLRYIYDTISHKHSWRETIKSSFFKQVSAKIVMKYFRFQNFRKYLDSNFYKTHFVSGLEQKSKK